MDFDRGLMETHGNDRRIRVEYSEDALDFFSDRHADTHASFLLPYLRPGMSLLDCGCGPGSITLDLAEYVSPGEVVGVDIEYIQIERANSLREKSALENIRFEVGDVTDLRFEAESFDVVFAHGVIEYLDDPVQVFKGMSQVLREGGILALRHGDWGGFLFAPDDSEAAIFFELFVELMKTNGGDPFFGRNQISYLRKAGFSNIKVSASYDCWTISSDVSRQVASYMAGYCKSDEFIQPIIDLGLSDRQTLKRISKELLKWGENPDAFAAEAWGEAIAYR